MQVKYRDDIVPDAAVVAGLYRSAGLNRPVDDTERIAKMYRNSNLIVSAWDDNRLVGVARSVTDFAYCCYLSDLAVHEDYKSKGIGKELIRITKDKLGDEVTLILLSAPAAMEYYPKNGFDAIHNGFIIQRKR